MAEIQTRILPVHRLRKVPPNKSLAEWWADEKTKGTTEASAVIEAAEALRSSDIPVGFPTETVYGLGADATRSAAVQGIYKAKKRPSDNPLIIHVDSIDMINKILNPNGTTTTKIPAIYEPLISRFWPGPLTILLQNPPGSLLAQEVTANLPTFGVRMPSSAFARLLIHVTDRPLAGPSANASTKPSPTTAQHVYHDLKGRIDLILDGGPCGVGVESTVVDGLSEPPAILRPGGIGIEEIRACPGWENVQVGYHDSALQHGKEAPRAPGMKYRHYSPKARVVLFEAGSDLSSVTGRVKQDLLASIADGQNIGGSRRKIGVVRTRMWPAAISLASTQSAKPESQEKEVVVEEANHSISAISIREIPVSLDGGVDTTVYDIDLGSSAEAIARGLFAALRSLDEVNVDVIYIEGIRDDEGDLAAAVMNRIRKAAEVSVAV
jgi:L-threonylcarbamoyladenylate synthase